MEIAAARTEKIKRIIAERRIVSVNDLCRMIGASPATIRRDLRLIEKSGEAKRVHGGAIIVEGRMSEPLFDDKAAIAAEEKHRIAEKAVSLIKPRFTIFLDGGSTVLAMTPLLITKNDITVVTNSLRVVMNLAGNGPNVILVGGEFRRLSQTFIGPLSGLILEKLHFDIAFIGTIGLTTSTGMTTTDPREAFTKEMVIKHAGKTALLCDSSKIGKTSFVQFGKLEDIDLLLTDASVFSHEELKKIKKKGIQIITC